MAGKPAMFIGSSVEGKRIAEAIQVALEYDVDTTVWHQGVFGLSGGTLESLVTAIHDYDFATLVLTADDLLEKRHVSGRGPRDNVLFELGLFMGALGRSRTFIVHSRTTPPMLPSDLAGVTAATFEDRTNVEAALGPACTRIKRAIESQGMRPRAGAAAPADELARLNLQLFEQNAMVSELFRRLIVKPDTALAAPSPGTLDFLRGAWLSLPSRSHGYCMVENGMPHFVYCYGGNSEATGEYHDFRRVGDEIVCRFRWFDADIHGYAWLKIDNRDRLDGAWCMGDNVPATALDNLELLRQSKVLNASLWTRREGAAFPDWALAALPCTR
jgi:predicted nucleotide-binding protein with TIR-like domain